MSLVDADALPQIETVLVWLTLVVAVDEDDSVTRLLTVGKVLVEADSVPTDAVALNDPELLEQIVVVNDSEVLGDEE